MSQWWLGAPCVSFCQAANCVCLKKYYCKNFWLLLTIFSLSNFSPGSTAKSPRAKWEKDPSEVEKTNLVIYLGLLNYFKVHCNIDLLECYTQYLLACSWFSVTLLLQFWGEISVHEKETSFTCCLIEKGTVDWLHCRKTSVGYSFGRKASSSPLSHHRLVQKYSALVLSFWECILADLMRHQEETQFTSDQRKLCSSETHWSVHFSLACEKITVLGFSYSQLPCEILIGSESSGKPAPAKCSSVKYSSKASDLIVVQLGDFTSSLHPVEDK